jgi:NAD(P)-dependent dehydrogenase (short-subunit alcohol dehydrogenase family)
LTHGHDKEARVDLQDKVAIITGALSDIGVATARRFIAEGAMLILSDSDPDALERLRQESAWPENRAVLVRTEGGREAEILAAVDQALVAHGRVDVLVNGAGLELGRSWGETDGAEWDRHLSASLTNVYRWCRVVTPHMKVRQYGKIVNIASSAGRYRSSYFPSGSSFRSGVAYASSQGGVLALTRELAFELAADGIYVNAAVLGLIETEQARHEWARLPVSVRDSILTESSLGRVGTPDEAAAVVCFLASERSSYITGSGIDVNGGWWVS